MVDLLPPVQDARILDAGCGSGWYSEELCRRRANVTSIDASARMVEHTRTRLANAASSFEGRSEKVLVADLSAPFDFAESSTFDGIISPLVLHYLEDWRPALREMRRVIKPSGWLLFSTHHPATEFARFGTSNYFAIEHLEDEWAWVGKVEFYRRPLTEISRSLADSGFVIERLEEPVPGDEFRKQKPESYFRLLRRPDFLIVR
ncbi:MAG TPA: class I SAM-dependent methyltransferase, partial [Gemmatimonadaceae bacterium]|nr:class I SAM-dependent methyltransferase [Gemmatimonadaceae bacterium]